MDIYSVYVCTGHDVGRTWVEVVVKKGRSTIGLVLGKVQTRVP